MYLLKSEREREEKQVQEHTETRSLREELKRQLIVFSSVSISAMEKQHRCKLCFRNFANGRALGGHMRSHMMKFYAEEKASKLENGGDFTHGFQSLHSYTLPSSSSSEEEEYDDEEEVVEEREAVLRGVSSYELRENPKKSSVLLDHDFPSVVVQGGESETESSEKIPVCRRRSKRLRETRISDFDVFKVRKRSKFVVGDDQSSPLSSISDTMPEEDVAHCLMMLSKDKWEKEEREYDEDEVDEEEEDEEESKKFGNVDIFRDSGVAKMAKNKFRGKYRCEECNKPFRSYQALGGHRASHKKIKANTAAAPQPPPPPKAEARIHQCPFCERTFSSGQALGGHKRTHFIGAGAISTNYNNSIDKRSQAFSIDLNLPAPAEEDESSQIAISAVSDD